jgi:hypothetical protein
LKFLGDAPADPELDRKLETMEDRAERNLATGDVHFDWADSAAVAPVRRGSILRVLGLAALLGLFIARVARRAVANR